MTLREWLKANNGKRVKIGSGGGYFYCDKVKYRKTIYDIKEIDSEYLNGYQRNIEINKRRSVSKALTKNQREYAKKNVLRLEKRIAKYTPLLTREVLDTYESIQIDEVGVVIVRVKGDETGKFWTMKEYEFDQVRKEKGYKYAKKTVRLRLPPIREFHTIKQ